jgi:ADP-dependent NAD(P)H-hydrate dehydratase / NAD(P)H-hydrate epimerase
LLPENEKFVCDWSVAEIGLDKPFIESATTPYKFLIDDVINKKIRKRPRFSHKGTFGHALILAGSYGKMGAAVLCAKACLKTGVGLLTVQIPKCGYEIMQISIPEAMCLPDDSERVMATLPSVVEYNAIGIGPSISKEQPTQVLLESLIKELKNPLVIDADALNLLSENKQLLDILPPDSILTPHPKEFERLAGPAENSLIRLNLLKEFCIKYKCITVLKGANTAICDSTGQIYFNSTGNPGMATGGSGDVLTGIITSLIAQGYSSLDAAIVGVYLHGFAGDCAAKEKSFESLTATDIIDNIYCFFKKFSPFNS